MKAYELHWDGDIKVFLVLPEDDLFSISASCEVFIDIAEVWFSTVSTGSSPESFILFF